jgi:DNA-cytosine methyltransferase
MNALSLFDGKSGAALALKRAGEPLDAYYCCEIDPHATAVSKRHHPDAIRLGDVTKWREWDIDWSTIDIVLAGSPCQGFSMAGKQLAFEDPRSKLFFEFVAIVEHARKFNPRVDFFLENVKMKKAFLDTISEILGVQPILINSSVITAQNRPRYYWCSWDVVQPTPKTVLLSSILDRGVSARTDQYNVAEKHWVGTPVERCLQEGITEVAFTERRTEEAKRIRREYREKHGRDFSPRRGKELTPRSDGKMNCLTATFSLKEHTLIDERGVYRRLTPLEAERLQTLPDGYTEGVSEHQRYRMIGNGWTIDVIADLLRQRQAQRG